MKSGIIPIRRALISVSDKNNLIDLAKFLEGFGVDLVSTGGTAQYLKKKGCEVFFDLKRIFLSNLNQTMETYAHFFDKHDKKMVDTLVAIQVGQKGDFF